MVKILLKTGALVVCLSSSAWAFRLSPMVVHFTPGKSSTQVLTLENPGSEKVPVQIEVFSRDENAQGEEVRKKTDEFNVYPEQVVLLPNEKRNVRVTWTGQIDSKEKAYRIIASQLPVEFRDRNSQPKKESVNLNFLLQYVASAYVTPAGAVPKITVKTLKALGNGKVSVTVANEGTAHQVLRVKSLKIFGGEKLLTEIASPKELESVNLLTGKEKTLTVAISAKEISGKSALRGELVLAESGD